MRKFLYLGKDDGILIQNLIYEVLVLDDVLKSRAGI